MFQILSAIFQRFSSVPGQLFYLISIALGVISALVGIKIYRHRHTQLLIVEAPDTSDELENLDEADRTLFFTSGNDVLKLRRLFLYDVQTAQNFATFVKGSYRATEDLLESYRILALVNHTDISGAQEIRSAPFRCRQLLCDLHYEASALHRQGGPEDRLLSALSEKSMQIRAVLTEIANCIQMGHKKDTLACLEQYSRDCAEYERLAAFSLIRCPFSLSIHRHVAMYYQVLRGDVEKSQSWGQIGTERSTEMLLTRSRSSLHSLSSFAEAGGSYQSWTSQRALLRIRSSAYRGSHALHIIGAIIGIVCISYLHQTNIEPLASAAVSEATSEISNFHILSLWALFNYTSDILVGCNSSLAAEFAEVKAGAVLPWSKITSMELSDRMERISETISVLDRSQKTGQSSLYIAFSGLMIPGPNVSLHLLLSQISRLTEILPAGSCTKDASSIAEHFYGMILKSVTPLRNFRVAFVDVRQIVINEIMRAYLINTAIFLSLIFPLLCIAFYIGNFVSADEREKFCSEILALESADLEKFQRRLQRSHEQSQQSISFQQPILGPDEIDVPESTHVILTSDGSWRESRKRRRNFYPILVWSSFLLFTTIAFAYRLPFAALITVDRDITAASNSLQEMISESVFAALNKSLMFLPFANVNHKGTVGAFDAESIKFDRAKELRQEIISRRFIANSTSPDEDYFRMLSATFHDLTAISAKVSEWRRSKQERVTSERFVVAYARVIILLLTLIVHFVFTFRALEDYRMEFESLKCLIMLLPSQYYASTANLIEKFRRRRNKTVTNQQNRNRYIIKCSNDPILIIDSNNAVQDVNRAALTLFNETRDGMIKRNCQELFTVNDPKTQDVSLLIPKLAAPDDHSPREVLLRALPSKGDPIPVACTFITIGTQQAVLVIDRTAVLQRGQNLENCQTTIETLLLKIMPRFMFTRMRAKNQELYMEVPHATFCFIAIWKFSEWCKNHASTEIMNLLETIVSAFDKKIEDFVTLDKIKIINGTYMAAGGLKTNEDGAPKKSPEVQMAEFAIKCLKWVRKTNEITNRDLKLQIGIHCGGPIIAGILGRDKPLFDVYGDSVNMSARLETTAPEDCIQISKDMADALPPDMVTLRERPNVFLKGKGIQTTYLVVV
jgi:class 3 adenylate cyclase/PAS domain-containing protein